MKINIITIIYYKLVEAQQLLPYLKVGAPFNKIFKLLIKFLRKVKKK
jgi:hypothetical protein